MNLFRRFAFLSLISTYFLVFVGGLVRVSGAGLGCPDWPKCFDRWIPPTDVSQLPAHIDPNLFNFTLAWIEYINRLIGVFVGLFIAITAVLAIKNMRKYPRILYTSIAAAILVAFQGWQGSQVVSSALEPFIITIHLFIALLIVSLLLYIYQQTIYLEVPREQFGKDRSAKIFIAALYVLTLFQLVLGTQIRSELEHLSELAPMLESWERLQRIGPVNDWHTIVGLITFGFFVVIFFQLKSKGFFEDTFIKGMLLLTGILMFSQLVVGFVLLKIGLPPFLQVLHLWIASLLIGALLVMFFDLKKVELDG